jgi:hypothetical protein
VSSFAHLDVDPFGDSNTASCQINGSTHHITPPAVNSGIYSPSNATTTCLALNYLYCSLTLLI